MARLRFVRLAPLIVQGAESGERNRKAIVVGAVHGFINADNSQIGGLCLWVVMLRRVDVSHAAQSFGHRSAVFAVGFLIQIESLREEYRGAGEILLRQR